MRGNRTGENLSVFDRSFTTRFYYDDLDRLQRIEYPDGESVRYLFSDKTSHETGIAGKLRGKISYDDVNRVEGIELAPDGKPTLAQSFSYESLTDELLSHQVRFNNETVMTQLFKEYDGLSRLIQYDGSDILASSYRGSFSYDGRGQLSVGRSSMQLKSGANVERGGTYRYNAAGELIEKAGKDLKASYDSGGQIRSIAVGDIT